MAVDSLFGAGWPSIGGGHSFPGCTHWRNPVQVGRRIVTCSTFNRTKRDDPCFQPGFGVYLAACWRDRLGSLVTNGSRIKSLADRREYPALFVDWPDMAGRPPELLAQLVDICLCKMRQGLVVDIGCHAGHGRTGTLLACLIARVEHLPAERAIAEVRRRYCRHAVEHQAQEKAIAEYVKIMPEGWKK